MKRLLFVMTLFVSVFTFADFAKYIEMTVNYTPTASATSGKIESGETFVFELPHGENEPQAFYKIVVTDDPAKKDDPRGGGGGEEGGDDDPVTIGISEYTVTETIGPCAAASGYLINAGHTTANLNWRQPAAKLSDLPGYWALP